MAAAASDFRSPCPQRLSPVCLAPQLLCASHFLSTEGSPHAQASAQWALHHAPTLARENPPPCSPKARDRKGKVKALRCDRPHPFLPAVLSPGSQAPVAHRRSGSGNCSFVFNNQHSDFHGLIQLSHVTMSPSSDSATPLTSLRSITVPITPVGIQAQEGEATAWGCLAGSHTAG